MKPPVNKFLFLSFVSMTIFVGRDNQNNQIFCEVFLFIDQPLLTNVGHLRKQIKTHLGILLN